MFRPVMQRFVVVVSGILLFAGCEKSNTESVPAAKMTGPIEKGGPKVTPPLDLKNPPADATRKPSGLVYKTLVSAPAGALPKRNDTVMIKYTGWRVASGETFFSNMKETAPMPLNLANTARGFTEALQLVRKGE